MRFALPVLLAVALVRSAVSFASGSCPTNGGTLCNVPGNVSQVAATYYIENFGCPDCPVLLAPVMRVVWEDDRNAATTGSDIYMNYYVGCPDSTLQAGTPVVTASGDQKSPVIVKSGEHGYLFVPGNFGIIVAWEDHRETGADIYARRFGGSSPSAPWDNTEIPICDAAGDQTSPAMVAAERGGAILGWIDGRSGTLQVYAQRVDSAGIGLWGTNGIPISSAAGNQELLAAAADGAGGTYFCWLDHRSGNALYAMRLTRDGVPASDWNAHGNLVANGVQLAGRPRVIVDAGGLGVSWTDVGADPDGDVFVQRLGPDGSAVAGWSAGGNAVAAGAGAQRMDDFVADGAGGCYVVWESEPAGGGDIDLYASRLDASGAAIAGWPTAVSVTPGRQDHAQACAIDGLYVIFSDDRNGERDIYATRLKPDGTLEQGLWIANGIVVTRAVDAQDFPVIGPGQQTANAAWIDYRDRATNGSDLYGTSISARGYVDVQPSKPRQVALGAPRPNPAWAGVTLALDLTEAGSVKVDVTDCAGRHVRNLISGTLPTGRHIVAWDGRTERGAKGAPGLYFVRARVGGTSLHRTVVLVR